VRLSPYPPQIAAQPLDSVFIPVIRQIVHTTFKPAKSAVYLLQCSGQGHAGGITREWETPITWTMTLPPAPGPRILAIAIRIME
jgi:hypothetical protein